jgi:DNA modification methylase
MTDTQAIPIGANERFAVVTGDARTVLASMPDRCVDAVVTDSPYSISVAGAAHKGPRGTRNLDFFEGDEDWSSMTDLVVAVLLESMRVVADHGSIYWFCGHRQVGPMVATLEAAGWSTRFLVWAKKCPAPPPPGAGWPSAAEICIYGYRPGRRWSLPSTEPPRSNVLTFDSYRHGQPGKLAHPTQKPIGLMREIVQTVAHPDAVILDPFCGSGTTGEAAIELGCRFVGVEKDQRYAETARNRLSSSTRMLTV